MNDTDATEPSAPESVQDEVDEIEIKDADTLVLFGLALTVTGVVLGVADTDAGKQLRVFVEAGFNSTTYTLKASQVVDVIRPQVEQAVAEAQAEQAAE